MRSYHYLPLLGFVAFPTLLANASLDKNLVDSSLYISNSAHHNQGFTVGIKLKDSYFRKDFNFENPLIYKPNNKTTFG